MVSSLHPQNITDQTDRLRNFSQLLDIHNIDEQVDCCRFGAFVNLNSQIFDIDFVIRKPF